MDWRPMINVLKERILLNAFCSILISLLLESSFSTITATIAARNPCESNPCLNKGTCLSDNSTDYSCKCREMWTGKNCGKVFLCETVFNEVCPERCTLNLERNTVYCTCKERNEYFSYVDKTCKKVDSCALMTCEENQVCESDRCVCKSGFFQGTDENKNKTICIPRLKCETGEAAVKECQSKNAICVSKDEKEKGYDCVCPSGFEMEESGCIAKCEMKQNIELCLRRNMKCFVNDSGDTDCKCPQPLQLPTSRSSLCEFVKYAHRIKLPIMRKKYDHPNASGRIQSNMSVLENVMITIELKTDIMKTIRVLLPSFHQTDVLYCKRQQDILWCSVIVIASDVIKPYLDLIYGNTTCVSGNGPVSKDFCLLESGLPLKASEIKAITITEIDVCDEELKMCGTHTICSKTEHFDYECRCQEGYEESYFKYYNENNFVFRSCKAIDVCGKFPNLCSNTTKCVNYKGDYYCDCIPGYKLKDNKTVEENKEDCEDLCHPNPCKMGVCKRHSDGFSCSCNPGGIGPLCEEDKSVKKCTVNLIIACAVCGSTLVLALVCVSIVKWLSKRTKGKGDAARKKHKSERRRGEEMVQRP